MYTVYCYRVIWPFFQVSSSKQHDQSKEHLLDMGINVSLGHKLTTMPIYVKR